jgi:hypothetical protein
MERRWVMDPIGKANRLAAKFAARLRATNWELIEKRHVEGFLVELDHLLKAAQRDAKPDK